MAQTAPTDWAAIFTLAVALARQAGEELRRRFGQHPAMTLKGALNPVTAADLEHERLALDGRQASEVVGERARGLEVDEELDRCRHAPGVVRDALRQDRRGRRAIGFGGRLGLLRGRGLRLLTSLSISFHSSSNPSPVDADTGVTES